MHGERKGRSSSTPSQSMLTDETNANTSTLTESACLPIGCSVSAKYRGAFCSAQVKTIDRQVKLKVILIDTNDTVIISEDQIVQPVSLRIGNTVTIRVPSTTHHDVYPHLSRSALTTLINATDHYDEKRAMIKQIYDNSIYTVVFNDGDEKSLRRSSLCLQGIRLYQTRIDQQKLIEDISTTSLSNVTSNNNDITSIVAVRRHGNNNQQVFPALILKRKSLADYIWVRSFLDGREYIVHKRNDIEPYKNNPQIQSLCRSTSKPATNACDKFIKLNQIPSVWQKKKTNHKQDDDSDTSDSNSSSSDSDVDDSDEETTEEKDSFIAQLFSFMDDRGTPINNIPKVHQYDLDLHRLVKIVRRLGGYNKVTKTEQWGKVYVKMGLPNEPIPKNARLMEHTYKKYLHAFEDLSKKLGAINIPSAYFGGRTNVSSDSRRSLIRVRKQSEDKIKPKPISTPSKQQSHKTQSIDSKQSSSSSTKIQSIPPRRKTIIIKKVKTSKILSSSSSDSESSDDDKITTSSSSSNINKLKKSLPTTTKKIQSPSVANEKRKITETKHSASSPTLSDTQKKKERTASTSKKKTKSTTDSEDDMKPVIKIAKISSDILKKSTLGMPKFLKPSTSNRVQKVHDNISTNQSSKTESHKQKLKVEESSPTNASSHDIKVLPIIPSSPSPPSSTTFESSVLTSVFPTIKSINDRNDDTSSGPSIFQSLIPSSSTINQRENEIEAAQINTNKRSYSDGNFEYSSKIDEQPSPSKRSRYSMSSQNSDEILNISSNSSSSSKQTIEDNLSINNDANRLTYEDISINDILLVKLNLNDKKQCYARCIEKNITKKEIHVHYKGLESKSDEWIKFDRVLQRDNDVNFTENEQINNVDLSSSVMQKVEKNKMNTNDQDTGIWKSLELASMNQGELVLSSSTPPSSESHNDRIQQSSRPPYTLPNNSLEEPLKVQQSIKVGDAKNMTTMNIYNNDHDQPKSSEKPFFVVSIDSTEQINVENILPTPDDILQPIQTREEIVSTSSSSTIEQSTSIVNESVVPMFSSVSLLNTNPDSRRTATRPLRRRTFRDSNSASDSSICNTKKRTRLDADINSNFNHDSINNSDPIQIPNEQQSLEIKRARTVGKRGPKRTVNQQDNENEDFHSNSPVNTTLRQQLEEMFKNRSSRYNFLDLNNNLTGDNRLTHLKDRMRQCQKVFFNLKSALIKIEKQRKLFVQRQKISNTEIRPYEIAQSTTNEVLLPSTCT